MDLYRNESNDHKRNAQRNLSGRTHYVDEDTLRFHKSRILNTFIPHQGLLFCLIESVSLDLNNTKRGVRYVIFDVFGQTLSRPALEHCYGTRKGAERAMWVEVNKIDAEAVTLAAIDRVRTAHFQEMIDFHHTVRAIGVKAAA